MLFLACFLNVPGKIGEGRPVGWACTHRKATQRSSRDHVRWLHLPNLLGPILLFSQHNYQRMLKTVRYFEPSLGFCPSTRHVISFGHQEGTKSFLRGPKNFKLHCIVVNYVWHIFPWRARKFPGKKLLHRCAPPGYGLARDPPQRKPGSGN